MIQFEDDKLIIEIDIYDPYTYWVDLYDELLDILQRIDEDYNYKPMQVFDLLRALMPGLDEIISYQKKQQALEEWRKQVAPV